MGKKGDEERKEGGQSMAETEGPREISENPLARQCGAAPRLRGDALYSHFCHVSAGNCLLRSIARRIFVRRFYENVWTNGAHTMTRREP